MKYVYKSMFTIKFEKSECSIKHSLINSTNHLYFLSTSSSILFSNLQYLFRMHACFTYRSRKKKKLDSCLCPIALSTFHLSWTKIVFLWLFSFKKLFLFLKFCLLVFVDIFVHDIFVILSFVRNFYLWEISFIVFIFVCLNMFVSN